MSPWWVFLFAFLLAVTSLFSNPFHFDSSFLISGFSLFLSMSFSLSYVPSSPICLSPDHDAAGPDREKTPWISQGRGEPFTFFWCLKEE